MKNIHLVNRGFLLIQPKPAFAAWANQYIEDELFQIDPAFAEKNCYLIEEDFLEEEPLLEQNYKAIFIHELIQITEDESVWPEINQANFADFFGYEFGSFVVDLQNSDLKRDAIFED